MTNDALPRRAPDVDRVTGACPHDCPDTCAIVTEVRAGRAISVRGAADHPITAGFLCSKVNRYHERTHHPDRVLHPLRRVGAKGEGRFARVGWDEALDAIGEGLTRVIDRDGAQSVLPYSYAGTMGLLQRESMSARFFNRMGASLLARTICASAGAAGWNHVYGDLSGPGPDEMDDVELFWLWGTNTLTSNSHLWPAIRRARDRGARVVVIDPLHTRTAQAADVHVPIKPGTDAAFAFGVMRVLIDEGLIDHDFVAQHAIGWESLHDQILRDWPLAEASEITGLSGEMITSLAIELGSTPRSLIRLNYGMQRHAGGAAAVRVACMLPTLTGAWRHPGSGGLLSTSGAFFVDKTRFQRADWIAQGTRTINMNRLGEALTSADAGTGGVPVSALIVYNSNPVIVAPQSRVVREGFQREDLMTVVIEQFLTDTAKYADWVLPATTQLEHWDVHLAYGHHYATLNRPAIPPLGEAAPNTEIFRRLADRMGYREPDFQDTDEELVDQALETLNLGPHSREELDRVGWVRIIPRGQRNRAWGELSTPSGRIELTSSLPASSGLDPVPTYVPPREAGDATKQGQTGLILLSPPEHTFLNSTFASLERQAKAAGEQRVWIHPDDARDRGICDEDMVEITNDRGAFMARAHITSRTRPGTVAAHGLRWATRGDDRTINDTTSMDLTDAGEGATFYDNRVWVLAVNPDAHRQEEMK